METHQTENKHRPGHTQKDYESRKAMCMEQIRKTSRLDTKMRTNVKYCFVAFDSTKKVSRPIESKPWP